MFNRVLGRFLFPQSQESRPDVVSVYDGAEGQDTLVDRFEIMPSNRLESAIDGAKPAYIKRHREAKVGLVLKNVLVWPELSVAATPEGSLIAETLPVPQYRVAKLIRYCAFEKTTPVDEVKAMTSIGCGYWFNYYHKLIDEVPRLWAIGERVSPGDLDVWVPSYYEDGFMDLLRALRPKSTSFVRVKEPSRPMFAQRYVHVPMLSNNFCGYLPQPYMQWLRSRLDELFSGREEDCEHPCRIYVSRSQSERRRLDNESEIQFMLKRYGYSVYHPETLPPLEQARLFFSAQRVAGVHGAGLTNILYASNAHLLEFFPGHPLYHYRWLCEAGGHIYQNIAPENPETHKHGDFRLSADRLEHVLKTMENTNTPPAGTTRKQ